MFRLCLLVDTCIYNCTSLLDIPKSNSMLSDKMEVIWINKLNTSHTDIVRIMYVTRIIVRYITTYYMHPYNVRIAPLDLS